MNVMLAEKGAKATPDVTCQCEPTCRKPVDPEFDQTWMRAEMNVRITLYPLAAHPGSVTVVGA
jgi:hypothetical protein